MGISSGAMAIVPESLVPESLATAGEAPRSLTLGIRCSASARSYL